MRHKHEARGQMMICGAERKMFSFDPSVNSCAGFRGVVAKVRPNCGVSFLASGPKSQVTRHELAVRRNPSYVKSDFVLQSSVER